MKISIVGIGRVGSTLAYTVMMKALADQLVLVGRNARSAVGDAEDLQHALSFTTDRMQVVAGSCAESRGSNIIVLSASVPRPSDSVSRTVLAPGNARLFSEIVPPLAAASPEACIVVISNPVDALTYHTLRLSGFPPHRVMGTGTLIDSARFRTMLSAKMGIHPDDLRAYILGEHGPTQFPALSLAQVGGEPIGDTAAHRGLFDRAVAAGDEVLRAKGYTNYAVAMAAALILEAIVRDTRRTMPVSTLIEGQFGVHDVCLSVPAVIGAAGVVRVLKPPLSDSEAAAFRASAQAVRSTIDTMRIAVSEPRAQR